MSQPSRKTLIVLGIALFAAGLLAGWLGSRLGSPLHGVPTIAVYDDWRVACPGAAQKDRRCALNREVIDGKSRARVAALSLKRTDTGTILTVTVPLNVLIGPGLGLMLGKEQLRTYPFVTCLVAGCIAQVPVDGALLARLREEPRMQIRFAARNRRVMQVAFPLDGFRRAEDAARRSESLFW